MAAVASDMHLCSGLKLSTCRQPGREQSRLRLIPVISDELNALQRVSAAAAAVLQFILLAVSGIRAIPAAGAESSEPRAEPHRRAIGPLKVRASYPARECPSCVKFSGLQMVSLVLLRTGN